MVRFVLLAGFISLWLPGFAQASGSGMYAAESKLYFHLHQATGLIEAVKTGRCLGVAARIESHLSEAQSCLVEGSELGVVYRELRAISRSIASTPLIAIESIREELHTGATDAQHFDHMKLWHREFRDCSTTDE